MAILAGVGLSKKLSDPKEAGFEACKMAIEEMGGGHPDLTITFSSVAFDQDQVVAGIQEASGNAPSIGCSDAGEITTEGPTTKSVAVMAIKSDNINFTTGLGRDVKGGARAAGKALAEDIKSRTPKDLRTLLMLPDVLTGNGADIVRGVLDSMGANFPVAGGAAGDDFAFEKTYQYRDGEVTSGSVVGVGLSGPFSFAMGVRHGWVPVGPPMKVTKSDGAVVHTLDGRPAVSIYEDYFGKRAEEMRREPLAKMAITYPLGLKLPNLDEYLIRDPITVDDKGAITCAAEIPMGSEIRLMIGNKEKAIEAAQDAAKKVMANFESENSKPRFILIFNCIAREKLFAQKAKDEIDAIMKIIGPEVPLLGFYTYGEQAPLAGETKNTKLIQSRFYNETVVIFAVGE